MELQGLKDLACATIDAESQRLNQLSQEIWQHKELSFEEHKSHATLTQFLEEQGFHVERQHKLDTAFVARWPASGGVGAQRREGEGGDRLPHIAIICEYDALPDIGHACGHNLIAELGVAASLGVKAAMKAAGKDVGLLSVIGTPAEEGGGGKIDLIRAGVFADVDVAMMAHPAPFTDARPIFLGCSRFTATFHGRASHAAGYPWEGVNALDALVNAYVSVATLRQQLHPSWRVHSIITKGGTKPNIIPSEAEGCFQVRAPRDSGVKEVDSKVKRCIRAAADAAGCTVDITDFDKGYSCLITNETLAKLYETNGSAVGIEFPPTQPKKVLGSTDMGNLSHVVPSLHPTYNCGTTAANHTLDFTAAAGSPDCQASTLAQGKALAMVTLDLFFQPELLSSVQADFLKDQEEM